MFIPGGRHSRQRDHKSKSPKLEEYQRPAWLEGNFIRMKVRDEDREGTECVGLWRSLQGLLLGNHLKGFIRRVAWPDFKASFSSFWLCGQKQKTASRQEHR